GVFQVDLPGKDLDHALRRFGLKFWRGVASKDNGKHPALAGLCKHVCRQCIRNSIDTFCHGVRGCRRQNECVVRTEIKCADRRCAGGGVAKDTHRFRKVLPIHANDRGGRAADKKVNIVQTADNAETLLEEVPRPCQRPSPAWLFDFGHSGASKRLATRSCKSMGVPGVPRSMMALWVDVWASAATMEARAPLEAKKSGNARSTMPRAAKSAARSGLANGPPCFTSTSCWAPIWPASQAARLSEVISQLGGISGVPSTIFVGDHIATFPARSARRIAVAESAIQKRALRLASAHANCSIARRAR